MEVNDSRPPLPKHSVSYKEYFDSLSEQIDEIYKVAEKARATGWDPAPRVEIPKAHDVAARVEATLDGPTGVASRIRELQEQNSREEVAFQVAKEIAQGTLGNITDMEKAADKAVRVALAILTESITAAPLEGISKVRIHDPKGTPYLALYLAGPIRAAGGTEAAVTVLVADYVRQVLGLPAFVATEEEVERSLEEVELYARSVHLQYPVHPELVRFAASNLSIMLTGDPTEEFEVSAGRNLDRIETNRVRGGSVLVLNDGVVGRASKLAKIVHSLKISGWEWLDELAAKMSKADASESEETSTKELEPKSDYLADVIGGRPVFAHPSRIGGFRLRYGRSRNTGLAGVGVHPATMLLVDEFLSPGTHIRTERPGKGSIVAPVDTIEGPIVLLEGGEVRQIFSYTEAKKVADKVQRVLYLGDILIALGEFLENNHPLVPSGYCEEWWSHDLENAYTGLSSTESEKILHDKSVSIDEINALIESPLSLIPRPEKALDISLALDIPLHPRYTWRWQALSVNEFLELRSWILSSLTESKNKKEDSITLPHHLENKKLLEKMGTPHSLDDENNLLITAALDVILAQLGDSKSTPIGETPLEAVNSVSKVEIRDRVGFSIGARMGRPEKAEVRKMRPAVHVLFPVGRAMASERRIERVAEGVESVAKLDSFHITDRQDRAPTKEKQKSGIEVELVNRQCPECGEKTFKAKCPACGTHTETQLFCSHVDSRGEKCDLPLDKSKGTCPRGHDLNLLLSTDRVFVDIQDELNQVKMMLNEPQTYDLRGVLGLTNDLKIPEFLGKGVLRAKHDVYCYRDGTARFDATDAPLTHFTPNEIGVPFWRLRELGYHSDYDGEPLTSDNQTLELKVQDIIIPEKCAEYMIRVGNFVDDCLDKIYGLERFYNFSVPEDVIGHLVIGLAPHTSAGIIGRIIGFTTASLSYAHPYWHAAKRRNCDGDEDAIILVMDALTNFSRHYLPKGRGGFMDAPLVLSVILNPSEVDDESHNMEVCRRYPAHFYEMVAEAKHPKIVENLVDIIASRLDSEAQYEGFGFTHNTSNFDMGPTNTRYKTLGSMVEKLEAQLQLATLIDAVDSKDVAERVLSHHFLRDIRGNLRAYSTQKTHCVKCHRVYRRPPLSGKCVCGETLSLTVRERNISKYLELAQDVIDNHGLGEYLKQRLSLINQSLDSLFVSEQTLLEEFF
ncbi:DNA polymerase II large subunit [Candidatus Thorarchaeota archaeon]|nr:MAG: DNA polymerase II large subunit [Candidatus Thorarchaeota archaeon]